MSVFPINPGTPPPAPAQINSTSKVIDRSRPTFDPGAFQRELNARISPAATSLTFSRHAQKRLDMRGISFTRDGLNRIEQAVDKASEKGGRDALVMAGELALVVNVPSRTVVTVMNRDSMQESVVTNIDSAVFA
jgi:flagellar operon protein